MHYGPTYIAEGIETALSLKEVQINGRILVSLGLSNMANIGAHLKNKDEPVILCADADAPHSAAWKTSERALEKLQQEGFKVFIIRPQGENGRDFNDVLQEEGMRAVRSALEDQALFKEILSTKQTQLSNNISFGSTEKETLPSGMGLSTKEQLQEKIILDNGSQGDALKLYLNCKEKLKELPSIIKAQGEEKLHVKRLNKESLYHAHIIWKDNDLKQQACNLGLEAEIQKKAKIYHYDIAWDAHSKKSQEENALDLYLKCELKLKNLPSIVVAKGQEKEEVRGLLKEARLHAHAVYQDPSLKMRAQELGLEKAISITLKFINKKWSKVLNKALLLNLISKLI